MHTSTVQHIRSKALSRHPPSAVQRDLFHETLNDARDEAPLQAFLATYPNFLERVLAPGRGAVLYDRPRLGSQYIPDFLISVENSHGRDWTCIELESPTARSLSAAGEISAKLAHAIGQINDWRNWLQDNVAYARQGLGLEGISSDISAWIVIGRRVAMSQLHRQRYASLDRLGIKVLSYDRLLDV